MVAKFLRYGAVALLSAATDWAVFALFGLAGGSAGGAALMAARLAGGLMSFFANRHWTWRDGRNRAATRQGGRFLLLYGGSWTAALALFTLLSGPGGLGPWRAKLITDALCFVGNFLIMQGYVFHRRAGLSRLWTARPFAGEPSDA